MSGWIGKVLPGFKQTSNLPMDLQDGKALYFNDPFYGEKTLQIFKGYYSYRSTENDSFTNWEVGIDPAFSIDADSVVIKVTYNNEETVCIIKGSDLRVRETYYIAEHKMYRWKALEAPPVTVDSKTIAHYYNGNLYLLKPVLDSSYSQNIIWMLDLTDPTAHWGGLSIQVTYPDSSEVSQILYGSCGSECYYVICPSYGDNIHECKLYSFNNGYIGDFVNLAGNRNVNEPYSFLPPTDSSALAYVFREVKTRVWEDDEPIDEDIPKCQALNMNTLVVSYPSDKNPLPYNPSNAVPVYVDGYIHLLGGNSSNSSIRNHYGEGIGTPMPIKNSWISDTSLFEESPKRVCYAWIGDENNHPKQVLGPRYILNSFTKSQVSNPTGFGKYDIEGGFWITKVLDFKGDLHVFKNTTYGGVMNHYRLENDSWTKIKDISFTCVCVFKDKIHILYKKSNSLIEHYECDGENIYVIERISSLAGQSITSDYIMLDYNGELTVIGGNKHVKWTGTEWVEVSTIPELFFKENDVGNVPHTWYGCNAFVFKDNLYISGDNVIFKWTGTEWVLAAQVSSGDMLGSDVAILGNEVLLIHSHNSAGVNYGVLEIKAFDGTSITDKTGTLDIHFDYKNGCVCTTINGRIHVLQNDDRWVSDYTLN